MPDQIVLNEPTAALREIQVKIRTPAGEPATGITEGTATILVSKPGGDFVSTTATLTEIDDGNVGGKYRLRFPASDVDTVGDLQFEITQGSDIEPCDGYVTVRLPEIEEFSEAGLRHSDLFRLIARTLVAVMNKSGNSYVIRDLADTKDSHTGTVTGSGRIEAEIVDPTP